MWINKRRVWSVNIRVNLKLDWVGWRPLTQLKRKQGWVIHLPVEETASSYQCLITISDNISYFNSKNNQTVVIVQYNLHV